MADKVQVDNSKDTKIAPTHSKMENKQRKSPLGHSSCAKMAKKEIAKNINDLPVEMFQYILQFLNLHETVTIYSKTCVHWKETIALHILSPEILSLAQHNGWFKKIIEKEGWTEDCNNTDFILQIYGKYDYYTSMYF